MENNELDKLFKDALAAHEFLPQEKMWTKIENQLPTKNKIVFLPWLKVGLAAALMGALVTATIIFYVQKSSKQVAVKNNEIQPTIAVKENETATENDAVKNEIPFIKNKQTDNKTAAIISNVATNNLVKNKEALNSANNSSAAFNQSHEDLKTKNNSSQFMATNQNLALAIISKFKSPFVGSDEVEFNRSIHRRVSNDVFIDELLRRQLYFVKGFHVGVKTEFGNSWISASVPASSNLNITMRYVINAALAYGFTAGYDFNNKYGVQIEYHTLTQNAQLSEVLGNSSLQNSTLKLNYHHIPLLFKIKWHPLRGIESKPVVMNYVFGIQYGWLNSNSAPNIDYTLIPNDNAINKPVHLNELNAVAAISYDVYFNSFFFLSFGGRATFGGNMQKYSSTDLAATKSRNLNLGLELGLHYKLPFLQKRVR